jgi:hypothetical protein
MQAKLIMGGGPHIRTTPSLDGVKRWELIMSKSTKPVLKLQPEKKKIGTFPSLFLSNISAINLS